MEERLRSTSMPLLSALFILRCLLPNVHRGIMDSGALLPSCSSTLTTQWMISFYILSWKNAYTPTCVKGRHKSLLTVVGSQPLQKQVHLAELQWLMRASTTAQPDLYLFDFFNHYFHLSLSVKIHSSALSHHLRELQSQKSSRHLMRSCKYSTPRPFLLHSKSVDPAYWRTVVKTDKEHDCLSNLSHRGHGIYLSLQEVRCPQTFLNK